MLRKIAISLGALVIALLLIGVVIFIATGPQRLPTDAASAQWLQPGPFEVAQRDYDFVDSSRDTNANRDVPGKASRSLPATLWYPRGASGELPLIVHSHGILSSRAEMPYLMEALASQGFLVIAADYPLTNGSTEGGANAADVVNQPADVSFLIDSVLALSGDDKPFAGSVDTSRIGLSGYSLGGLTTLLTTFHPRLRDPRIAAAVAIAAPSAAFAPIYFDSVDTPLLAIAGTADALIEHRRNAADLPVRDAQTALVSIDGGSHLGFVGVAEPTFRFMDNPDTLGCSAVLAVLGEDPNAVFNDIGTVAEGVDMSRDLPGVCDQELQTAVHPGRQQMITQAASVSFFVSQFDNDTQWRAAASQALKTSLPSDFAEASFTASRP